MYTHKLKIEFVLLKFHFRNISHPSFQPSADSIFNRSRHFIGTHNQSAAVMYKRAGLWDGERQLLQAAQKSHRRSPGRENPFRVVNNLKLFFFTWIQCCTFSKELNWTPCCQGFDSKAVSRIWADLTQRVGLQVNGRVRNTGQRWNAEAKSVAWERSITDTRG